MSKKLFSKKQTREIAIEFAKYLMDMKVSICDGGEPMTPKSFKAMGFLLNADPDGLMDGFINHMLTDHAKL